MNVIHHQRFAKLKSFTFANYFANIFYQDSCLLSTKVSCQMVLDMARQIKSKIDAVEAFTETTVETVECYCLIINQKNIT